MIEAFIIGIPLLILWAILVRLSIISIVEEVIEKENTDDQL